MSPQARWQAFRQRLPRLTRRQSWALQLSAALIGFIFILFILPYLLPLAGETVADPQTLADPNGHFYRLAGGETLYFQRWGTDGLPVVLVHGFGGSSQTWKDVPAYLADYQVYAPDLLGFGLSAKGLEQDLSPSAQAERLVDWWAAQRQGAAHWLGFDLGAGVVLALAHHYPEKVASVSIVAANPPTAAPTLPTVFTQTPFLRRWGRVLVRWLLPSATEINLTSAAYQDNCLTPGLLADYGRTYQTPNWELSLLALARSSQALPTWGKHLDKPLLLVWGDKDGWVTPSQAETWAVAYPQARRLTLPDVGHLPMHEDPGAFYAGLRAFWAED